MRALVMAGRRRIQASAICARVCPRACAMSFSAMQRLPACSGVRVLLDPLLAPALGGAAVGGDVAAEVLVGQQPGGQRAEGDHARAGALGLRQQVPLDACG